MDWPFVVFELEDWREEGRKKEYPGLAQGSGPSFSGRLYIQGRSLDLCLDTYRIPVSTSPADNSDTRLIEQLDLQKFKKEFSDKLLYDDISFGNNSTSVTSFTECFNPKMTRLSITDFNTRVYC